MSIFSGRSFFPFAIVFAEHYEARKSLIIWPDNADVNAIQVSDFYVLTLNKENSLLPIPPKRAALINLDRSNTALLAAKSILPIIPISLTQKVKSHEDLVMGIENQALEIKEHLKFAGHAIEYQVTISSTQADILHNDELKISTRNDIERKLQELAIDIVVIPESQFTSSTLQILDVYTSMNIAEETELFNLLNEIDAEFNNALNITIRGPQPAWSLGALTEFENDPKRLAIKSLIPGFNVHLSSLKLSENRDLGVSKSVRGAAA